MRFPVSVIIVSVNVEYCEISSENRRVHAHSCVMGNQGKMVGNSKICIGIQSQLIVLELIYLIWCFLFENSNLAVAVERNNILNLEYKDVRGEFLENS